MPSFKKKNTFCVGHIFILSDEQKKLKFLHHVKITIWLIEKTSVCNHFL